jgi:hypothetical protein
VSSGEFPKVAHADADEANANYASAKAGLPATAAPAFSPAAKGAAFLAEVKKAGLSPSSAVLQWTCIMAATILPVLRLRIVVDLLRREFADLRKSQVAEGLRMVTPTIPGQPRVNKEASPKHSGREVQTGVDYEK